MFKPLSKLQRIVFAAVLFFPFLGLAANRIALPDTSNTKKAKIQSVRKEEVFNPDDYFEKPSKPARREVNYKSILKFNPLLVLLGDIPFYYEQKINSSLGWEIGAGLTTVNYASFSRFLTADAVDYQVKSGLGYSARASFRYYYGSSAAVIGWYLAPEVQYKLFNSTVDIKDYSQPNDPILHLSYPRSVTDGRFVIGYQNAVDGRATYDVYFSLGLRYLQASYLDNIYLSQQSPEIRTLKVYLPILGFGLKMGLAL